MPESDAPRGNALLNKHLALMSRPRPGLPLPDRENADQFFEQLDALCRDHGYHLGRSTWETPERSIPHFLVQILAK
ncbi:hypothetical protein U9R89_21930 [Pectobacterium brasiliense]